MNHNIFDKIVKKFSRQGYHIIITTGHKDANMRFKIYEKVYTDRDDVYKKIEEVMCSEATKDRIFNYLCSPINSKGVLDAHLGMTGVSHFKQFPLKDMIVDEESAWNYIKEIFKKELEKNKNSKYFEMYLSQFLSINPYIVWDNGNNDIYISYNEVDIC